MTRSGAPEHLRRRVKWILARREPAPLQTIRPGWRLLNTSHLHCAIEEPTLVNASRTWTRLNSRRGARTIERRSFPAGLRIGIRELALRLRIILLGIALLGIRRSLLWIPLLRRAERSWRRINVLLRRVGLLGIRRSLWLGV